MFILAISPITSLATLSKFITLIIFTKYRDLAFGTSDLAIKTFVITNSAIYI